MRTRRQGQEQTLYHQQGRQDALIEAERITRALAAENSRNSAQTRPLTAPATSPRPRYCDYVRAHLERIALTEQGHGYVLATITEDIADGGTTIHDWVRC